MTDKFYEITLSKAEALVLFEFLARFKDSSDVSIRDSAEEVVLWKILGVLESKLADPFAKNYLEILEEARASLRLNDE
jgi:hypothetical protein